MKAAELFVAALENEGVRHVFGVPGEETLDLLEAIRGSSRVSFVPMRHEQSAGLLAATYGRLTGKAGVVLGTLGPGATNLVTALAFANLGGMPLVAITGQKPIKASKQGRFQILDVVDEALSNGEVHLINVPITYDGDDEYFASILPRQVEKLAACEPGKHSHNS